MTLDTSLLGFIPARGGSARAPRKNVRDFAGSSLLALAVTAAIGAKRLDRVGLSTDREDYAAKAAQAGLTESYRRPAGLATDSASAGDCVLDYLQWSDEAGLPPVSHVVLLQPTSPFRTAGDIDGAIDLWRRSGRPSLASVTPAAHNPRFVVSRNRETGKQIREGKNDDRDFYVLDGAVFITPVEMIRDTGRFWDEDSELYVKNYPVLYDIDTKADFAAAEAILRATAGGGKNGAPS